MRAPVVSSRIHGTASRTEVLRQTLPFSGARLGGGGMTMHGLDELRERLEIRASEAEAEGATAPVANVYRLVLAELAKLNGNGKGNGHNPAPEAPDKLLTAKQVAERLECSPRYVYAHAETFPFTRREGHLVRFSASGLDRWLAKRP